MKLLCSPCQKVLERGGTELCTECQERMRALLAQQAPSLERPEFWVPAEGEHAGVPGMSRMGKSTWMKDFTAFLMEEGIPIFWWDPQREASRCGIPRKNTPLGPLRTQVTVSDVECAPKRWLSWVARGAKAEATAIVPDEEYPDRETRAADFARFTKLFLSNKPKGRVVLFLEECGLLEGHREAETALVEMATTWAKEGVTLVFGTQSTSMVPDKARRQWKRLVLFAQRDKYDLRAVSDLTTPHVAALVKRLQPHECFLVDRMNLDAWERPGADEQEPDGAGAEEAA